MTKGFVDFLDRNRDIIYFVHLIHHPINYQLLLNIILSPTLTPTPTYKQQMIAYRFARQVNCHWNEHTILKCLQYWRRVLCLTKIEWHI